jgi:hypothetical protein
MQLLCEQKNAAMLRERFDKIVPPEQVEPERSVILHFTNPKPTTASPGFHGPVDHYRKEAARRSGGWGSLFPGLYIWMEELEFRLTKWWRGSSLRKFHRYIRPLLFWKRGHA